MSAATGDEEDAAFPVGALAGGISVGVVLIVAAVAVAVILTQRNHNGNRRMAKVIVNCCRTDCM